MGQKHRLFYRKDGKATLSRPAKGPFSTEEKLRDFAAQNLKRLFEATCLDTEYKVGRKRIDIIGITEGGRPVLVECKKHIGVGVVDQISSYYHLLRDNNRNRQEFRALVKRKSSVGINFKNPRLICLAEGFTDYQLGAWDLRKSNGEEFIRKIEFVSYDNLANKVLVLNWLRGDPVGKIQVRDNSLAYIQSRCDNNTLKSFKKLSREIDRPGKGVIQYDTLMTRNFKIGNIVFACLRPVPQNKEICAWFRLDPDRESPATNMSDTKGIGQVAPRNCRLKMKVGNKDSAIRQAGKLALKASKLALKDCNRAKR